MLVVIMRVRDMPGARDTQTHSCIGWVESSCVLQREERGPRQLREAAEQDCGSKTKVSTIFLRELLRSSQERHAHVQGGTKPSLDLL